MWIAKELNVALNRIVDYPLSCEVCVVINGYTLLIIWLYDVRCTLTVRMVKLECVPIFVLELNLVQDET